jgi:hypothetical protein
LDRITFQDFLLLFGCAFPLSVFTSVICFMSAGLFREWWEQPRIFRLISRGDYAGRNPTVLFVFFACFFALVNVLPVLLLIPGTAMARTGLASAYFAVLALWFAYVAFAALRARSVREGLPNADTDEPPVPSAERARHQALINQLDFEDAIESSSTDGVGEVARSHTTADQGEPCAVYPVELQGARTLPTAFDVGPAADSYQGALVLELAKVVDPLFPRPGAPEPDLVVRSRIVIANPGNRLVRYSMVLGAALGFGAAVFEVEAQIAAGGVPLALVRAQGERRWGYGFGGDSQDLLVDAARLAGERAASQLLAALASRSLR